MDSEVVRVVFMEDVLGTMLGAHHVPGNPPAFLRLPDTINPRPGRSHVRQRTAVWSASMISARRASSLSCTCSSPDLRLLWQQTPADVGRVTPASSQSRRPRAHRGRGPDRARAGAVVAPTGDSGAASRQGGPARHHLARAGGARPDAGAVPPESGSPIGSSSAGWSSRPSICGCAGNIGRAPTWGTSAGASPRFRSSSSCPRTNTNGC